MPHFRPHFFDLARLKRQLDADSEVSLRQLRQRDALLRQDISSTQPLAQLLSWLWLLETKQPADKYRDTSLRHLEGLMVFALAALGIVVGILSMTGMLFANQQQPVNILLFLAVFVGLQLALVIVTLIGAFLPLTSNFLHSPLSLINPASWALKRSLRDFSALNFPWQQIPQLSRLLLIRWGQMFGTCFNLGLIASFWVVLLFNDRSFGWSSTLSVSQNAMEQLLNIFSLPWRGWIEGAAVSSDMINSTRFQSLQTQFSSEQVVAMRAWWPYLMCALITYGLLPRIILWLVFDFSYRRELKSSLLKYPGVSLVLDRLNTPLVDTQTSELEDSQPINLTITKFNSPSPHGNTRLVDWAGALKNCDPIKLRQAGVDANNTLSAGLQLDEDQQAIALINQEQPATVLVAVKSWEPPLAELGDFIAAINSKSQCVLLLIPLGDKLISDAEWKDWQYFTHRQLKKPTQLLRIDDGVQQ